MLRFSKSPRTLAALAVATLTATGAGAATIGRFAVTQQTGSEGATAYLNTSNTGGALQAEIGSNDTTVKLPFALLGEYLPTGGSTQFGIGTGGVSVTGYGVAAETLGANPAMYATSSGTGDGIDATASGGGYGGSFTSAKSDGLDAISTGGGVGIFAEDEASGGTGIYVQDASSTSGTGTALLADSSAGTAISALSGGSGVIATKTQINEASVKSNPGASLSAVTDVAGITVSGAVLGYDNGEGVVALGNSGTAGAPAFVSTALKPGTDLIDGVEYGQSGLASSFVVQGTTQNRSATVVTTTAASDVQVQGDIYLTGKVYSSCNAFPAVKATACSAPAAGAAIKNAGGEMVSTFASRHAAPTVEDEGEATMVSGSAHVALDPTFASTISRAQPYLVFTSPNGDCRGLFISHRTPAGFDVRELGAGRSSLTFSYRIVAKPLVAEGAQRMAIVGQSTGIARPNNAFKLDFIKNGKLMGAFASHKAAAHPMRTAPRHLELMSASVLAAHGRG